MTSFIPCYDRLLVRQVLAEEITAGGIYVPISVQDPPLEGYIVAKGKGRMLPDGNIVPIDLKVGERVYFGKYSGAEIQIDAEVFKLLKEDDVLGVVELGDK